MAFRRRSFRGRPKKRFIKRGRSRRMRSYGSARGGVRL